MEDDTTAVDIAEAEPDFEASAQSALPAAPAPAPRRRGRVRRWTVNILLGLLIFSCGAVTGGGVVARAAWNRVSTSLQYPEQMPARAAQHLTRLLRLDEEQSASVKEILKRRAETIAALRGEIAPRIDAELEGIRDEVSAVLRPEQVKRWNRIFDDLRPKVFPASGGALIQQRRGR